VAVGIEVGGFAVTRKGVGFKTLLFQVGVRVAMVAWPRLRATAVGGVVVVGLW